MVTSAQCLRKYGHPTNPAPYLTTWDIPIYLRGGPIPKMIYCNTDLLLPLREALTNIHTRGLIGQLHTWDGCFNIRKMRGGTNYSLHSWGIAVDINATTNPFGGVPTMSPEMVACWVDAGFDWGGRWQKPDGQHFQLRSI